MHKEGGHIVETAVEARAGFLDRPTLAILTVKHVPDNWTLHDDLH